MSEVEKLKIGNTSYDIKDATAAHSLSDIAVAREGIEFVNTPFLNATIVGSPSISSSYVASGFSDSNYLTCPNILNNASSSFELVTAVKMTTAATDNLGIIDTSGINSHSIRLTTSSTNTVHLRVSTTGGETYPVDITGTTLLTVGTKVWIKVTYDSTIGYALYTSTDGSTWTLEGSSADTTRPYQYANELLLIGDNAATSLSLTGSIYLADTYINVNNGQKIWNAVETTRTGIATTSNAQVDQTYDSTSANAQSGVAIDGAGFLKNTSTSNVNLGIFGTTSSSGGRSGQVSIGPGANTGYYYCIAIGNEASATSSQEGIAIGRKANVNGGGIAIGGKTGNGIAIGTGTTTTSTGSHAVAIGSNATGSYAVALGNSTSASATSTVSIGYMAKTSANYAIQLGYGTNSTANTFSVGLSDTNNYQLLDSSGHIPAARLTNAVQGALTSSSITLAAADWSTNTQTVTVNGITSSSFIWVSPAAASASDYADAGILCTAQATNSLTFTCDTTPSTDITVTIVFG